MDDTGKTKGDFAETSSTRVYLDKVTIGERTPHNSTIRLVPYDPNWPFLFEQLARRIHRALPKEVRLLEHVGSTSVAGLTAKPVIDLVLAVLDSTDEAAYVPALEAEGFVLRIREPDWFEHRLFKAPVPEANLHVFSAGCDEISRMLTFRNWLRSHDADRRLYERTKQLLAAQTWTHVQEYANAKSEIVNQILARAEGHEA